MMFCRLAVAGIAGVYLCASVFVSLRSGDVAAIVGAVYAIIFLYVSSGGAKRHRIRELLPDLPARIAAWLVGAVVAAGVLFADHRFLTEMTLGNAAPSFQRLYLWLPLPEGVRNAALYALNVLGAACLLFALVRIIACACFRLSGAAHGTYQAAGGVWLRVGLLLTGVLFYTVLLSSVALIFGGTVGGWPLVAALLLSAAQDYLYLPAPARSLRRTALLAGFAALAVALAALACSRFYSVGYDGNAYHKIAVGLLDRGWNPVYETSADAISRLGVNLYGTHPWVDIYPKGTWLFAANVYALTGSIEAGKCYTLLGMACVWCVVYGCLREACGFGRGISAFCGAFLSLNLICLTQLMTYYADGFLGCMVMVYIVCILACAVRPDAPQRRAMYLLIFMSACLGMNTKQSGLLFFGLIGAVFYLCRLLRDRKALPRTEFRRVFRRLTLFFVLIVLVSLCLMGANSYGTNQVRHGNFLYGVLGDDFIGFDTQSIPTGFEEYSRPVRYLLSLFGPTGGTQPEFKLPYTFDAAEFKGAMVHDVRVGGWGMLFGGLFLFGLAAILAGLYGLFRRRSAARWTIAGVCAVLLILPLVAPGMWWARFHVQVYMVPMIGTMFLADRLRCAGTARACRLSVALICLMVLPAVVNALPGVAEIAARGRESLQLRRELAQLCVFDREHGPLTVAAGRLDSIVFQGGLFDMMDMGVTDYTLAEEIPPEQTDGEIFRHWIQIQYADSLEEVRP